MKVPEGLLLRQDCDVVLRRILNQFFNLSRSECRPVGRVFRRNERLILEVENMLHVEAEQIDLVLRQSANLHLQIIELRNRPAADIVAHAAPFHAGPIVDDERWNL